MTVPSPLHAPKRERVTDKSADELEVMWLEACGSWRTAEHERDAARADTRTLLKIRDDYHEEIARLKQAMTRIAYALGYSADDRARVVDLSNELLTEREVKS